MFVLCVFWDVIVWDVGVLIVNLWLFLVIDDVFIDVDGVVEVC